MSSTLGAFGLKPVYHPSGQLRPQVYVSGIASGYGTSIYNGSPVILDTNGQCTIGTTSAACVGSFAGWFGTTPSTAGRPQFFPSWTASTTYSSTEPMYAYVYIDPLTVYQIQADGSLAGTAVGDQADFSATAGILAGSGNTTSGYSTAALSTTLAGAGSAKLFKILSLAASPDNAWGDTYTVVNVQINKAQFGVLAGSNAF